MKINRVNDTKQYNIRDTWGSIEKFCSNAAFAKYCARYIYIPINRGWFVIFLYIYIIIILLFPPRSESSSSDDAEKNLTKDSCCGRNIHFYTNIYIYIYMVHHAYTTVWCVTLQLEHCIRVGVCVCVFSGYRHAAVLERALYALRGRARETERKSSDGV